MVAGGRQLNFLAIVMKDIVHRGSLMCLKGFVNNNELH